MKFDKKTQYSVFIMVEPTALCVCFQEQPFSILM